MIWTYLPFFEGSTSSRPICQGDGQPERGLPPPDVRVPAKRARKGETCLVLQTAMEFILVTLYTTIPFPLAVSESANSDVQRFASE